MYVVSNMGAMVWPIPVPTPTAPWPIPTPTPTAPWPTPAQRDLFPTLSQFEAFDKLLRAAIEFDKATGQAACETAVKTAWIKQMYDHFGLKSPL
jgi:hypothetical protein